MRLRMIIEPREGITIPFNYNYFLNSFVYHNISEKSARIIHGSGGFKFFVFSNLLFESKRITNTGIETSDKIRWFIASPYVEFLRELGESVMRTPILKLGKLELPITEIEILREKRLKNKEHMTTISPIAVSTGIKKNGYLLHRYLSPNEALFFDRIRENLLKKYRIFFGKDPSNKKINITITGPVEEKLVRIKRTPVKAYNMHFLIEGDPELLQFAMDAGLGEKNSMGFGMVVINERVRKPNNT